MPVVTCPADPGPAGEDRRAVVTAPLPRDFLARPAQEVAPELLGCVLVHETAEGLVAAELTEVEAYAGEVDPASHAYRGKTGRNAVMYGPPGYAYVYFTYGMHFCVNVVCMPAGTASAVLLRAGRIVAGEPLARRRRTSPRRPGAGVAAEVPETAETVLRSVPPARDLARGPARLCQSLAITRTQNGADLCAPDSELRLLPSGSRAPSSGPPRVSTGPRVGVTAAADTAWRFYLADDPTVSVYRPHKPRLR
jgi:DNA-3-methyladenine glycosylase